ncbi:protein hobbit [Condylostylus longicornis]|uniref:protein hobbit n=1 Tax=Condylostylus longicornis TaxID=2530218 RepID=UPI00244E0B73|nr:protein hobbit [Condylostylus longicornis]
MSFLVVLIVVVLIFYGSITWAFPLVISWWFNRKFKINVRAGRMSLPLSFKKVNIYKNGFSVQIEEISISSSFLNSEVTKLLSINLRDIRINKDIDAGGKFNDDLPDFSETDRKLSSGVPDFRKAKIPPSIVTFAQFMAVHVYNVSVVLINNDCDPSWFIHATAKELHLDGSIVQNDKTLLVNSSLTDAQAKMLLHSPNRRQSSLENLNKLRPCLAEISFDVALDATLIAQGPLSVEKLQLSLNNAKTTIYGGMYEFLSEAKLQNKLSTVQQQKSQIFAKTRSYSNDAYHKLAPIIPRNFGVAIKAATVTAVKENTQNDFNAKMQLFTISGKFKPNSLPENIHLPNLYANLALQHLDIDTKYEKLLFIEEFTTEAKLENEILNIFFLLRTFQIIYNHSEIYGWVNNNFLSRKKSTPSQPLSLSKKKFEDIETITKSNQKISNGGGSKLLEWMLKRIVVKACAELWNISMLVKLDDHNAGISMSHSRMILAQYDEKRSSTYNNHFINLLLNNRHWSVELMFETLWWSLGNSINDTNNLKKNHSRGSPFFLALSIIKLSSYANIMKLDFSIHNVRAEYSIFLAEFVVKTLQCIKQYGWGSKICTPTSETIPVKSDSKVNSGMIVSTRIEGISVYFINHHDACILVSLSEVAITRTQQISVIKLERLQMAIMRSLTADSMSVSDFTDIFCNFKIIRLEYEKFSTVTNSPKLSIYILDDTEAFWNSNLHMHIYTLYQDIQEFKIETGLFSISEKPTLPPKEINSSEKLSIELSAERNTLFEIKMSERHSMQWYFENLFIRRNDRFLVSIENVFIKIDDQHIFTFKDVDVQTFPRLDMLTVERQNSECLTLLSNKVWVWTIEGFKAIFPYDHDFSDAVQNEFVSLFKWLKLIHNYKKKEFTVDSPLPSDLIIQIKEFLLEMSDDPFEVKLRDNYVLLVDEYLEGLKREKIFRKKLAEKYSDRLLLPAGAMDNLYKSFLVKNSEIYIQRSKKIKQSGPVRTRLFAWIMTDLEILAMADPSIHGKENVIRIMREIDSDSPWPEEGLDFVTLWCRYINVSCTEWKFMLRDFPQPMFQVKMMRLQGNLVGAEQAAPKRARRDILVDIGHPFGSDMIQRGMTALKFYHDFECEVDSFIYAFGPCWEPVMAQCNLSFEKIQAPSRDPSPVLPFWDKMRLMFHGRVTMLAKQFTVLLHASLDPYNTTEEMELTWNNVGIMWQNAKIIFKGQLNITVRTASRYDDCRLLHFPQLKLSFKLNWVCLANPNDHHAVIPCAPDKLPEYSSNQVHDSFRAFRSQNLNIWISFETKNVPGDEIDVDIPSLVLYGSTLRWFESLKLILSGVTRPTRRGPVFNNIRPRKKQLSRHYKKANLQMSLHKFQILYWMSHALHRGFQLNGGRVSFSSEHILTLSPIDDGLVHRPRADWSTIYMNCELNDAEIWLKSVLNEKFDSSAESLTQSDNCKIVRFYFLSLDKVSYGRETHLQAGSSEEGNNRKSQPTHKLVVYDLKGAWTKSNRDVAFALFDSFMKNQKLKNNLGTEALKGFRKEGGSNLLKNRRNDSSNSLTSAGSETVSSIFPSTSSGTTSNSSGTIKKSQHTNHATAMLQQLIAEADHKFNVYSDDNDNTQIRELHLQGLQACNANDVIHENWSISLVNSQVLLKGCETSGYVILSAAKAEILQRVHRPVWRDRSLISKTTWKGSLECMQYYATVSAGESDAFLDEKIMWLTVDNIQEKDKDATVINDLPDLPHLVGSGQSVGGVVSETVGVSSGVAPGEVQPVQLQRIVSRCKCEFFYVSYGDTIDPNTITEVPPPPSEETLSPWEKQDDPVDAFTLMHHDLDVCTNSLQYAMILDIVNNLMLYVEPQRKQALEKLARMRFQLQLYSSEDQKRPIQHLQTQIRSLAMKIRAYEKDLYFVSKARQEEGDTEELLKEFERIQDMIRDSKEELNIQGEELDMKLICYKETQLSAMSKITNVRTDKPVTIVRANEICFKRAQWRLTETDGQIGIADLVLSDFLYTKKSKSDDSVEHLLELGNIRMNNLIPREIYREVIYPTEIQKDMPVDAHKRVLRVFCREKPPVGGISVKEHFEINVAPITIAITKKFYNTMMKFCFPDRDASETETDADVDDAASTTSTSQRSIASSSSKKSKPKKSSKESAFYVKFHDDVEKMKERAEKNKLFIYIKIPEVPVRVSYKGNKEKNLEDITDFSLVIPTLEYHNVTWTWLDLLMAMKSVGRSVIVKQAIKQKLQIKRKPPILAIGDRESPQEEDKAKMLFGDRLAVENRSQRKKFQNFTKSS